ncbi:MAG: hypothetical protein LBR74_04845 [Eubacterium sp.]|jgi:hypothetical protein|nr:hypothetical protein [Eubacterium sp.]
MAKRKKMIQKSLSLSEIEWAVIESISKTLTGTSENPKSNGDVIRYIIDDFIFFSQIKTMSVKIKAAYELYRGRLEKHQIPQWLKEKDVNSLTFDDALKAYPIMADLIDLFPDIFSAIDFQRKEQKERRRKIGELNAKDENGEYLMKTEQVDPDDPIFNALTSYLNNEIAKEGGESNE